MNLQNTMYLQMKDGFNAKPGKIIQVKDLVIVLADHTVKTEVLNIEVLKIAKNANAHIVVSILTIIEKIKEIYPQVNIFPLGDSEILIKISNLSEKENKVWLIIRLTIVCSILFVGAGLALMNFHADVNMRQAHKEIYKMITGIDNKKPLILHIPYSLGIGLGMAVFFNHILPQKFSNEPSPMEVEMASYRKSMDEFILNNEKNTEEK
ncbi:stage V sporulation protein AA [Clostridiaceae bacterium 35-E11]